MYILAFETTGAHASVALIDRKGNVFEQSSENVLNHLTSLIPITENLMKKNGINLNDISCVAASAGPGSFTGIRIGVSSARAIAQAAKIPCISVPTLKSFLYNIKGFTGIVCPILDARRCQVYGGAFTLEESTREIKERVESGAYDLTEYLQLLSIEINKLKSSSDLNQAARIMFFGDGIEIYKEEIESWHNKSLNEDIRIEFADKSNRFQKASSVAKLALKLYNEGKQVSYDNLMPIYMRKAEAERKLEQGRLFIKSTAQANNES